MSITSYFICVHLYDHIECHLTYEWCRFMLQHIFSVSNIVINGSHFNIKNSSTNELYIFMLKSHRDIFPWIFQTVKNSLKSCGQQHWSAVSPSDAHDHTLTTKTQKFFLLPYKVEYSFSFWQNNQEHLRCA